MINAFIIFKKEFQNLFNKLFVILEYAAVSGLTIEFELGIR